MAFYQSLLSGNPAASHFRGDAALSRTTIIILFNPDFCVAIFFVLSGFVLAASMAETQLSLPWLILRRWTRLALPVIGASLLAWLIPACGLNFAQPAAVFSKSAWLADQYAHVSLTAVEFCKLIYESAITLWYPHGAGGDIARFFNSNLWTMPIEFIGSICLFAVYKIFLIPFAPEPIARVLIATLILALSWQSAYYGFPAGVALFECQKCLRLMAMPAILSSRLSTQIIGVLFLAVGVVTGGTPFNVDPHGDFYAPLLQRLYLLTAPESPIPLLHHFGAVCIVAGVLICRPARRVLEHRVPQFLGKISFMVYLIQIPILCSAGAGIVMLAAPRIGYNHAAIIAAGAYIFVVLAVATLGTRVVDMPATQLSRVLSKKMQLRRQSKALTERRPPGN